jgi:hypothetical protein
VTAVPEPKQHKSYSAIVAAGLKRVREDFSQLIAPLGFKKIGRSRWARTRNGQIEEIWIERAGSSYGAPINSSVRLRLWLSSKAPESPVSNGVSLRCDKVRRPDGGTYHHRFNAMTLSTYDLCLDHLDMFVTEFAQNWFDDPSGAG